MVFLGKTTSEAETISVTQQETTSIGISQGRHATSTSRMKIKSGNRRQIDPKTKAEEMLTISKQQQQTKE
jgi:hypothetical protein